MGAPVIRRIAATEVVPVRALRLRALADTPDSFGSTYEREQAFAESTWAQRTRRGAEASDSATWVADEGGRLVGMVVAAVDPEVAGRAEIFGVWVDPAGRRAGTGRALIEAAAGWAVAAGMAELALWVVATNVGAISLYEKAGFKRSRAEKPMPRDHSILEIEMVRQLPPA